MIRLLSLVALIVITLPLFGQDSWHTRQYVFERAGQPGPRGAVTDRFEYIIRDDRVLYRPATGPGDEPYREVALPGKGLRVAATNERVYVWIDGAVLDYSVGDQGLKEPANVLSPEDPAALAALRFAPAPTMSPAGRQEVVISPQRLLVANMGGGVSPTGISVIQSPGSIRLQIRSSPPDL